MPRFLSHFYFSLYFFVPVLSVWLLTNRPLLAYIYESPKWIFLFAAAIVFLLIRAFRSRAATLPYPRFLVLSVGLYALGVLLSLLKAPWGHAETTISQYALCLSLGYWAFLLLEKEKNFYEKLDLWNIGTQILVLACTLVGYYVLKNSVLYFFASPTMYGEYLGFTIVLQIYSLIFRQGSARVPFWLRITLLAASALFLFDLRARGAMLGVLFSACVFASALALRHRRKVPRRYLWTGGAVLLIFGLAFAKIATDPQKIASFHARVVKWKNTAKMIAENPAGIGLGNFRSAYMSYRNAVVRDNEAYERVAVENPHNSFLEMAAEAGLLCFFAFLAALIGAVLRLWKKREDPKSRALLTLGLIAYWTADGLFNFPQDLPYPFFTFSLIFALIWHELKDARWQLSPAVERSALLALFFLVFYFPVRQFYSEHISFTRMLDPGIPEKACRLDPQNWRACLVRIEIDWAEGRRDEALRAVEHFEARFPNHYEIRKKTIQFLWDLGRIDEACEQARAYDAHFDHHSTIHNVVETNCKK